MDKIMPFVRFVNVVLQKVHIPIVDERQLHQRFTYASIKKLVPVSLRKMEKARTWRANVGLSHSENVYVMWWTGVDTMPLLVKKVTGKR